MLPLTLLPAPEQSSAWAHAQALLARSAHSALDLGSSNLVSFIVFVPVAGIVGLTLTVFLKWRRGGRDMAALKNSFSSLPAYLEAFGVCVITWGGLFVFSLGKTIYEDHNTFASQVQSLKSVNARLIDSVNANGRQITALEKDAALGRQPINTINKEAVTALLREVQQFITETQMREKIFRKTFFAPRINGNEISVRREEFDMQTGFLFYERFGARLESLSSFLKHRGLNAQRNSIDGALLNGHFRTDPSDGQVIAGALGLSEDTLQILADQLAVISGLL